MDENLYALPMEFWGVKIFEKIGDIIGLYRYIDKQTEENISSRTHMSKARMAVWTDASIPWTQAITLASSKAEWTQKSDTKTLL